MKNKTIWEKGKNTYNRRSSFKNLHTDILIIGGGIAGLSVAYYLKNSEKKVTLIDKGSIFSGVSSKTTAKITYLQGAIYQTLEKNFNLGTAKKYFNSQIDAISSIRKIIEECHISCDFCEVPSITFTLKNNGISKVEREREILKKWGVLVEDVLDKRIRAGIKVFNTYTFHPLKYLEGIASSLDHKVDIYENTLALEISFQNNQYQIRTNKGNITATSVVVACHYPFFLYPSFIPLKTYVKREYVNVSKVQKPQSYMAINIDSDLHSIRYYQDYLIYGSNMQRLTSKIDYKRSYEKSRDDFKKYFGIDAKYTWMNQDIMSNDSLPFIGEVRDNLYMATAFNAWGMTNGTISGKVIADLILYGRSSYQYLFDPKRMNKVLIFDSIVGSFHYMKVYAQSLWKKNNPSYVKIEGVFYGIYIDEVGKRHVVKLLCPHMKCNLVFNREEKTWDCPCHGSRFDLDGNIIEGPANSSITRDE